MMTTNTLPMTFVKCMIEFLVDNIYVRFGGQLFRQTIGIPMGTNCAPLLADLLLYSYESELLDKLVKEGKRKLARKFNLSYCYIDDLIAFNNKILKEFISDIYPKELTISETTESTSIASYLDLLCTRDKSNNIMTKLDDKRDTFGFYIVNFPFMSSNIPSAPACGVYGSQLIRYAHCCSNYSDFLLHHRTLVTRLCHRVTKLFVCPTHLINSMADTWIYLDKTRKMSAKCLLILSVEMIFIFDRFVDDQINKISWDGGCHA